MHLLRSRCIKFRYNGMQSILLNERYMKKNRCFPTGLYGITPDGIDTHKLISSVKEAAKGGMHALQLRRKDLSRNQILMQAKEISAVCRDLGVIFIVNDNLELALTVKADGVHIGKEDSFIPDMQSYVDSNFFIGVSCYNDEARLYTMSETGASYLSIGSIFFSHTKPKAIRTPLSYLKKACKELKKLQKTSVSIVAIGGIRRNNVDLILRTGVKTIAVSNDLFQVNDVRRSAEQYVETIQKYSCF